MGCSGQCTGVCAGTGGSFATCACHAGASCDLTCKAGPCNVACDGANPACKGEIAGTGGSFATATCGVGSSCAFACNAAPCNVTCAGTNASCTGVIGGTGGSAGQAYCGPGSNCTFTCAQEPCTATCDPASKCALVCKPGSSQCSIPGCTNQTTCTKNGKTAVLCNGATCPL